MADHNAIPVSAERCSAGDDSGDAGSAEPAEPDRPPSPEPPHLFSLQIDPAARVCDDAARFLEERGAEAVRAALRATGADAGADHEVRALIVGDDRMASLHERYKDTPGTTDVLTFDAREGDSPPTASPLDVDIVICVDEASRQAEARGHGVGHELLLYIVHALLHCLGHDDADEESAARMHACEDEILAAMGLGAIFAASSPGGGGADETCGAAEPTC